MNKIVLSFCMGIMLLAFSSASMAQGSLLIKAGTNLPVGDFYDETDCTRSNFNGATWGLGGGLKYSYIFSGEESGVGVFGEADVYMNKLNDDAKRKLTQKLGTISDAPYTISVPVTLGLGYTYKFNKAVSVYGEAGPVFSMLKLSDLKYTAKDGIDMSYSYEMGFNAGIKAELGALLFGRLNVSATFYGLGNHDMDVKNSWYLDEAKKGFDKKINYFSFNLGYRIF